MSGDALLNLIRREVERVVRVQVGPARTAIVTQFDPVRIAAIVTWQPEGTQSGWLPVLTQWMGNGWGIVAPLQPGDQVAVVSDRDHRDAGIVLGRIFDTRNQPPQGAQAGELWMVHQSGSLLKLLATGDVQLTTARDLNATVGRDLNATVGRNLNATVTGTLTATVTGAAKIVSAAMVQVFAPAIQLGRQAGDTLFTLVTSVFITLFNSHTHNGVQPGSGNSGPPNQTAGAAQETSIVTAE